VIDIYHRTPINKTAALVTGQAGCEPESDIGRDDIIYSIDRLQRKHRLIKRILGIEKKTQHTNLMYRYNKKGRTATGHKNPRIVDEYVRIGIAMQEMQNRLVEIKNG